MRLATYIPSHLLRVVPAVVVLAGLAAPAHAAFQVKISVNDGIPVFVPALAAPSGGTISFNGTYGDFNLVGAVATSNANAPETTANVTLTFTAVLNSNKQQKLEIWASDDGFNFPVGGNYALSSSGTGDWNNGDGTDTVDLTGSQSDGPVPIPFGVSASNPTIALVNPQITPDLPASADGDSGPTAFFTSLPFGMTAYAKVVLGGQIDGYDPRSVLVTESVVAAAVPEPSSLALVAIGGFAFVGLRRIRRRGTPA